MTTHHPTLDGVSGAAARFAGPGRAGALLRCCLVVGLVAGLGPGSPALGEPSLAVPDEESNDARQDRQLREEQLRAAQALADAYPQNDDAQYLLGLVRNVQGDAQGATSSWIRSIELDPTRADAHHDLGYAYLLREDYARAIEHLGQAVALAPADQENVVRLAHAYFLAGQYGEALTALEGVVPPTALAERLRGQAYQRLERYAESKAAYASAIRLQPDFAEAYFGMAAVCARLGELEEAARLRAKFNELKSESQILGRRARTDYDPLAETQRSAARTHVDVARVYAAIGRLQEAEQWWTRAAELDPDNIECRFYLASLFQRTGRVDDAVRMCREMIRKEPDHGAHHLSLGNLERRQGRLEEAEKSYRKVIELAPERPEGHAALAQLLLHVGGRPAEAEELAQRVIQLAPVPDSYFLLAQACAAQGEATGAWTAITHARRSNPANPPVRRTAPAAVRLS